MLKRTIYIGNPSYLHIQHKQLLIRCPSSKTLRGSIPVEDIAIVLIDHPQVSITTAVLNAFMDHKVVFCSCDQHHLPHGMMLPMAGHTELTERWRDQLDASAPLKKQLWKQTVKAKIENQRRLLEMHRQPTEAMDYYLEEVYSGDPKNMEGKAANHYWKYILPDFRRDAMGFPPNNLLNFGYAILRSMVARALVSSGLLLSVGIFHKNKYNAFCLADDIMEPYRPFLDRIVVDYVQQHDDYYELDKSIKARLLQLATQDVIIDNKQRPLLVALSTTTASLYKCFAGTQRKILYPSFVDD